MLAPSALTSPTAPVGFLDDPEEEPPFFKLHVDALIDVQVRQDASPEKVELVASLRETLADAAEELGLSQGERLRTVVVGDHCSLVDHFRYGTLYSAGDPEAFDYFKGLKRQRRFAKLLGRALETLSEVELHWLSEALPDLVPQAEDPSFAPLAAQARRDLEELLPSMLGEDGPPLHLKFSALPLLYLREHGNGSGGWLPMTEFIDGRLHSTTRTLFAQYREFLAANPGQKFDAVLVKLLLDDDRLHNRADPPMVTREHLEAAQELGLTAILLDRRHGIIRPDRREGLLDLRPYPPVLAA